MQILGVRPQTLYAYVSRGWIRSIPQEGKKDKLYLRDDINRVVMRSLARSGHGAVAPACSRGGHAGERTDDCFRVGGHAAPRRRRAEGLPDAAAGRGDR